MGTKDKQRIPLLAHANKISLLRSSVCSLWGYILVAQTVKNPSAKQGTWVQPLGWEDPLKKGRTTHSSILAWRISWTEEPGRLQSIGSQRVLYD